MSEIAIDDAELDAMMAELEAECSGAVERPKLEVKTEAVAAPVQVEKVEVVEPISAPAITPEPEKKPKAKAKPEPVEPKPIPLPEATEIVDVPAPTLEAVVPSSFKAEEEPLQTEVKTSLAKKAPSLDYCIDVDKFVRDTSISDTNLDKCMMEQSSLRAFHGAEEVRAEMQADRVKLQVEIAEASLYDKHRKAFAEDPTIKVTEKMVENAVRLDPLYAKLHNRLIEAEGIAGIRKRINIALSDRRDMLIQMGADRREDGKGQLRVMAEQAERANMHERAQNAAKVPLVRQF